ncbi:MAG TPA: MBL fold metallo-hydrolase [Rhizobiaceae bacterium]|nr:MBL fold metallo-hydrolase [Rhizobiaceae bacterium]
MFDLGGTTLEKIIDLDPFRLPLDFLIPSADIEALRPHRSLLEQHHLDFETGEALLGLHSLLLRAGGLTILIDTCVGEHKARPRRVDWHERADTGYLLRLAKAGVAPEDVDIVLCTHLHADHVGWNTRLENGRWIPTFPNARYLVGKAEIDHWQAEDERSPGSHNHGAFTDSVLPILEAGLLEKVEDGFEIGRGARLLCLPGHSPGQVGLCLDCGRSSRAFFCGDVVQTPVQVLRPDWSSRFCFDPALASRTRTELFELALETDSLIIPAHLRGALAMRVTHEAGGYRPEFIS